MSHNWIWTRILKAVQLDVDLTNKIKELGYTRHVLFFSIPHVSSHIQALILRASGQHANDAIHATHPITQEWGDKEIARVVDARAGLTGSDKKRRRKR